MLDYEERQNHCCRNLLLTFLVLVFMVVLCSCSGFVQLHTNLPLYANKVTFINNFNSTLSFLIDGEERVSIAPTQTSTFGYWVGGGAYQSQIQVSVTVLDRQHNCSWSDVVYFSSYYPYKYVFTAREDESGKLQVERR